MTLIEAIGWLGNAFYFTRFLVQWLLSERAGESVAPRAFWWLSAAGAVTLGGYAAFYRGVSASTARAVLVTCSRLVTYEWVKSLLV